jgi:putative methionine-R-sulfoxide reductase with GAF domain
MTWAAGHDLNSQRKFRLPVKDSLAQISLEKGSTEVWEDVTKDDRFTPHPRARRPFHSMVSFPIRIGDETRGVFNVVSDHIGAFRPAETNYISALGSVINVAVGVLVKDDESAQSPGG